MFNKCCNSSSDVIRKLPLPGKWLHWVIWNSICTSTKYFFIHDFGSISSKIHCVKFYLEYKQFTIQLFIENQCVPETLLGIDDTLFPIVTILVVNNLRYSERLSGFLQNLHCWNIKERDLNLGARHKLSDLPCFFCKLKKVRYNDI